MNLRGGTFSLISSHDTRVEIAGGVQIVGYLTFWDSVFHTLDIDMDDKLRKHLASKENHQKVKSKTHVSKEGKKRRGEKKSEKLNKAHDEWIKQQRTGDGYQTGVVGVLAIVKKTLHAVAKRNPKGTPKEKQRYPFYPDFCNILGHKDARNKDGGMKGKNKSEKDAAKKAMLNKVVSCTGNEQIVAKW